MRSVLQKRCGSAEAGRAKGRGYGEVRVVTGCSCLFVCACAPCGNRNMADKKVTGTVKWFNVKKGCTCPPPLALVSAVVNADMSALTCPHAPSDISARPIARKYSCGPACVLPGFGAPSGFSAPSNARKHLLSHTHSCNRDNLSCPPTFHP